MEITLCVWHQSYLRRLRIAIVKCIRREYFSLAQREWKRTNFRHISIYAHALFGPSHTYSIWLSPPLNTIVTNYEHCIIKLKINYRIQKSQSTMKSKCASMFIIGFHAITCTMCWKYLQIRREMFGLDIKQASEVRATNRLCIDHIYILVFRRACAQSMIDKYVFLIKNLSYRYT